uniref:BAH domain-containing protein n=1 Tax=Panagrellus redivivus TaxID=6233 RepID=A0A7E4VDT7_PANRE
MYRVGDYVYFEHTANQPYQIRRIEELQKGTNGNVEARVVCFYRRRDIPEHLLKIADQADRSEIKEKRALLKTLNGDPDPKSEPNGSAKAESATENGVAKQDVDEAMEVDETPDTKPESKDEPIDSKPSAEEIAKPHFGGLPPGAEDLNPQQVHLLRQRELFMSRQCETLSATNIRGKCSVVLLSDVETPDMYLTRDDAYFYSLVYDPTNETLIADKGNIRVGDKYQATIPELTPIVQAKLANERKRKYGEGTELEIADDEDEEVDELAASEAKKRAILEGERSIGNVPTLPDGRETLVFHHHHDLQDRDIDQYLILARAVGTFARALEGTPTAQLPTLHVTAAAASRDVTLLHALALLHHADYDLGKAVKYLVPPPSKQHYPLEADATSGNTTVNLGGPLLCRDQLEEWSPAEAHIFVEALEKYNKDFHEVRHHCLGWKSHKDIVEYYYMYKTSGRYNEARNAKKQAANDGRLKQVYIPCYNKPSPSLIQNAAANGTDKITSATPCESCGGNESVNWYNWGPVSLRLRVCQDCWVHWKKRGGLQRPHPNEQFDVTEGAVPPIDLAALQKQMTIINATGINRGTIQSTALIANQVRANPALNLPIKNAQVIAQMPPGIVTANQIALSSLASTGRPGALFFLHTPLLYKIARRLASKDQYNARKLSRNPFKPINVKLLMTRVLQKDPTLLYNTAKQFVNPVPQDVLDYLHKLRSA